MFEPQLRQARPGLVAPSAADRAQFAIDRDRRFPIIRFFKQMRRIESRLVKPKELLLTIGAHAVLNYSVIRR
jgi:hypothetical protein